MNTVAWCKFLIYEAWFRTGRFDTMRGSLNDWLAAVSDCAEDYLGGCFHNNEIKAYEAATKADFYKAIDEIRKEHNLKGRLER